MSIAPVAQRTPQHIATLADLLRTALDLATAFGGELGVDVAELDIAAVGMGFPLSA